jgi:hypothetical protein
MQTRNTLSTRRASPRRIARPLLATLVAAAACGSAQAEDPSPWYIGASVGVTHDSNVFRTPDPISDSYVTTSLLGGFDQAIGRQRLHATARVGYSKYQERDELNNTNYAVAAGWDWATIEKLSGSVNIGAQRALAQLNGNTSIPSTRRNLVNTDQVSTDVRWGGDGLVTLFANYGHSRVRYSSTEFISSKSSGDSGSLGVNYRLGGSTTVGAAIRLTRTVSPYGIATTLLPTSTDDFASITSSGRNLDLLANWVYSPQTSVNARLSFTRQTESGGVDRSFSGLTGAVSANYAPTAKLAFTASYSRDAGTNATYFNTVGTNSGSTVTAVSGLNQSSRTTNLFALGATYAATAKISVNSGVQYRRSTLEGGGNDNISLYTLGATYAVARNWQLACNLGHESRSVTGGFGYDYTANTVGCSAQFTLR